MKILFVSSEYPHFQFTRSGGIGTSIKSLATYLSNNGNKVIILVYGQKSTRVLREGNLIIISLRNIRLKGLSWFLVRKQLQFILNKLYFRRKFDIVEFPDWTGISALIKIDAPSILKLHGTDTFFCHFDKRNVKFRNYFFEKLAIRNAKNIIAVSDYVGENTNNIFKLDKKYFVIHNGVSLNIRLEQRSDPNFNIFYYGSIVRKKGILEIPFIFDLIKKQIPNAKLFLIGRDSQDLQSGYNSTLNLFFNLLSHELREDVIYKDHLSNSELTDLLTKAHVCIFPSFAECWPMSWLEAMSMGIPMVCSNIGWAKEMVEDGYNALLRTPTDHISFANAVVQLSNKSYSDFISKNAYHTIFKNYSINIIGDKMLSYYKKIIRIDD